MRFLFCFKKKCLSCRLLFVIINFVVTRSDAFWPVGQAVKTPPFHGGNRGSIPLRVTILFLILPHLWRTIVQSPRAISSVGRAPDF